MALLPSSGSQETVGVLITTVADDGAITTTQAQLTALGDTAKASGAAASSAFDNFNNGLKNVGQQMTEVGKTMSTYVTLPIAGIAYEAVKSAASFQQQMTYIRTQAGDTTDSISQLSDQVLQLAHNSEFTPDQLAQGLYHLASVGMTGTTAIKALDAAQQLAAVGGSNLDDTTQALTVAWKSGITGAQDFQQAVGTMNAIVGAGDMHLQDLVGAMGPTGLLAAAKTAGLTLGDIGATLAQLSDMTGNAQESATHLRQALLLMQSPSKQAADYLSSIGFSATQLGVDLQEKGMMGTLQDLKTHLENTFGSTALTSLNTYTQILGTDGPTAADNFANSSENAATVISKAFGGSKSSSVIMQLLANLDQLNQKEQDVSKNSSLFASDYATTQQTASYKMHAAYASMIADLTKLGETIMPQVTHVIDDVTGAITNLTNWFSNLSQGQKQFAIDALGIAAAVGPVLLVFGTLAEKLSGILTLTQTVGKGIGLLDAGVNVAGAVGSAGAAAAETGAGAAIASGAAAEGGTIVSGGVAAAVGGEVAGGIVAALSPEVLAPVGIAIAAAFVAHAVVQHQQQQHQQSNQNVGLPANSKEPTKATTDHSTAVDYNNKVVTANNQVKAIQASQNAQLTNDQKILTAATLQYNTDLQKVNDLQRQGKQGTVEYFNALRQLSQDEDIVSGQQKIVKQDQDELNKTNAKASDVTKQLSTSNYDLASTSATVANLQRAYTYANNQASAQLQLVKQDQQNYNAAVALFGPNSDKAKDALKKLTDDTSTYNQYSATAKGLQGDINNLHDIASGKTKDLTKKTQDLTKAQLDLNSALSKEPHGLLDRIFSNNGGGRSDISQWAHDIGNFFSSHFASGTSYARGGWSMVGENGPEMMYVPQGASVKTAPQTSRMLGGGSAGGGVVINQNNQIYNQVDMTEANRALAWQVSNAIG